MTKSKHGLIWAMIATILVGVFAGIVMFTHTAKAADDTDWSLYSISAAAAGYLNKSLAPTDDSTGTVAYMEGMTAGQAGGFLGYTDENRLGDEKGLKFLGIQVTQSALSYSYEAFEHIQTGNNNGTTALYSYCRYGYLLSSLGLDDTAPDGPKVIRVVAGGLMYGIYVVAQTAPVVMNWVLKILKTLNPFQFLTGPHSILMTNTDTGLHVPAVSASSPFYTLVKWYTDLYNTLYNISWALVIPIFFAALIVTLLLFKSKPGDSAARGGKIRRYIVRVFCIVLAVPILGSLYTVTLDKMENMTSNSNSQASTVIAYTFVDFESWAANSRLYPYGDTHLVSARSNGELHGQPDDLSYWNLRHTAAVINKNSGAMPFANVNGIASVTNESDFNKVSTNAMSNTMYDTSYSASNKTNGDALSMLSRYMSGDYYTSAMYGSSVTGSWVGDESDTLSKEISSMDTLDDWMSSSSNVQVAGRVFGGGSLNPHIAVTDDDSARRSMNYTAGSGGGANGKGLSVMAMYNYLDTSFRDGGIVVYSSDKSVSNFSRDMHYSVNMIGNGLLGFMYWLSAFVTLLAYAVVGWLYAFAILFGNLKHGVFLLKDIPFALLGSFRSMAKVVAGVIVMILEILVTFFVYEIVMQFLQAVPEVIMGVFSKILVNPNASPTGTIIPGGIHFVPMAGLGSTGGIIAYLIISSILMIVMTIQAMRWRKHIVRGVEEAVGAVVDRIFGTNDSLSHSSDHPFLRGAATAAGAAAGARMINAVGHHDEKDGETADGVRRDVDSNETEKSDDNALEDGKDNNSRGGSIDNGSSDTAYLPEHETEKDADDEGQKVATASSLDEAARELRSDDNDSESEQDIDDSDDDFEQADDEAQDRVVDAQDDVDEAQRELDEARDELADAEDYGTEDDVRDAQARVADAEQGVRDAQAELADAQQDARESATANAKRDVDKAQQELQKAKASGDEKAIRKAERNVRKAEQSYKQAQKRRDAHASDSLAATADPSAAKSYHDAQGQERDARAELNDAKRELQKAEENGDKMAASVAKRRVDAAQSRYDTARQQLADSRNAMYDSASENAHAELNDAKQELLSARASGDEKVVAGAQRRVDDAQKRVNRINRADNQTDRLSATGASDEAKQNYLSAKTESNDAYQELQRASEGVKAASRSGDRKAMVSAQRRMGEAQARYDTAQEELHDAQNHLNVSEAQEARGRLAEARKTLAEAQENGSKSDIRKAQQKVTQAEQAYQTSRQVQRNGQSVSASPMGDMVHSGNGTIDAEVAQAQADVNEAQRQLSDRKAELVRAKESGKPDAVRTAQIRVNKAQQVLQASEKSLDMSRLQQNAVVANSGNSVASAEDKYFRTQGKLEQAKRDMAKAQASGDKARYSRAKQRVDTAQQELREAQDAVAKVRQANKEMPPADRAAQRRVSNVALMAAAAAVMSSSGKGGAGSAFVQGMSMGAMNGVMQRREEEPRGEAPRKQVGKPSRKERPFNEYDATVVDRRPAKTEQPDSRSNRGKMYRRGGSVVLKMDELDDTAHRMDKEVDEVVDRLHAKEQALRKKKAFLESKSSKKTLSKNNRDSDNEWL